VQIAVALGGPLLKPTVVESVLTIAGFTTGIILGIFFLGSSRRGSASGPLSRAAAGLATITAVAFGTKLAWPWYTLWARFRRSPFGWLASFAWPREKA